LRRIWDLLTDERCRAAVEFLERHADKEADEKELLEVHSTTLEGYKAMADEAAEGRYSTPLLCALSDAGGAAYGAIDGDLQCIGNAASAAGAFATGKQYDDPIWNEAKRMESKEQGLLLYCIFGNPFRPVPLNPLWFTSKAKALAQGICDNRCLPAGTLDNTQMHLLAAALEEAGCTNEDMLGHCRGPGPHVRGCWVVDLVLGKSAAGDIPGNDAEWLACTEVEPLVEPLADKVSQRKLRLFACGCCRTISHLLFAAPELLRCLEISELYADARASKEELDAGRPAWGSSSLDGLYGLYTHQAVVLAASSGEFYRDWYVEAPKFVTNVAAWHACVPAYAPETHASARATADARQADIFRDLVRSPFRPRLVIDPPLRTWHNAAIPKAAQAAYEHRSLPDGLLDTNRLAALAALLEEAGCKDPELLAHLRSAGVHVRGCWALDAILGKT